MRQLGDDEWQQLKELRIEGAEKPVTFYEHRRKTSLDKTTAPMARVNTTNQLADRVSICPEATPLIHEIPNQSASSNDTLRYR